MTESKILSVEELQRSLAEPRGRGRRVAIGGEPKQHSTRDLLAALRRRFGR